PASSRPRSATRTAPSSGPRRAPSSRRSASTPNGSRPRRGPADLPPRAPGPQAPCELAPRGTELSPEHLTRVFFTSGGSEAVESALKLIRLHWLGRGEPLRRKVIARRGAYHG